MKINIERTLAIIKPDAYERAHEIEDIILRSGFTILQKKCVKLPPEQVSDFYKEHYGRMFFPALVAYMCKGLIVVYDLAKENAVEDWKKLIGPNDSELARETVPDSIRAIYGTDERRNAVHGTNKASSVVDEINFFFPNSKVDSKNVNLEKYFINNVNDTLVEGLTKLCKEKPENPITWLAEWLLNNNPNKPNISVNN
ncbi:hypothetical protein A3Q56_04059 [Intoshia linei]|uniref:Nucleoside diphosphate kinase-like domain-containing protein n=1 Tax=Intoshia linei TaxID=1819745 RepID=A0A177B1N6_9BILA|nr:hypothetical protein A3Q56_04059 [Intoshia linei]